MRFPKLLHRGASAPDLTCGFGVGRKAGKAGSLLWNDAGVAAEGAGRWGAWHDTAPDQGRRNAGIDFNRRRLEDIARRWLDLAKEDELDEQEYLEAAE